MIWKIPKFNRICANQSKINLINQKTLKSTFWNLQPLKKIQIKYSKSNNLSRSFYCSHKYQIITSSTFLISNSVKQFFFLKYFNMSIKHSNVLILIANQSNTFFANTNQIENDLFYSSLYRKQDFKYLSFRVDFKILSVWVISSDKWFSILFSTRVKQQDNLAIHLSKKSKQNV